jgi:methylated-DNA-protein-cysteine methyltransferase-like protein
MRRVSPQRTAPRSEWLDVVSRVVKGIPKGKTASYGQVALFSGRPGGARAVVKALHALNDVPWWRVVRSDGSVAEAVRVEQTRRLKREGVVLEGVRVPARHRL